MRLQRVLAVSALVPVLLAVPVVDSSHAQPVPVAPDVVTVPVELDAATPAPTASADLETGATGTVRSEPFSLVGLTWDAEAPGEELRVEVRTQGEGGWSAWQELPALDSGPDPGTPEAERARQGATAPLWVGASTAVQARVTGASEDVGAQADLAPLPEEVELVLVDPGTSAADGLPTGPAASADAATMDRVITRAEWGADESLRTCEPTYSRTLKAGFVHHTAGPSTYATPAEAMRQLRADYAYHTRTLGWCDLGYNFVIDKWGNVYEGRAGGIDEPVVGAHAGGFNADTFGVSFLGTYTDTQAPAAMVAAAERLFAWKFATWGIDPTGSTTLTSAGGGTARWPAGTSVTVRTFSGHRDVGLTACPGDALYAQMAGMRTRIAASVGEYVVQWYTRDDLRGGVADRAFPFGPAGAKVVACDWTGRGPDTPAAYLRGRWTLRTSTTAGAPESTFDFGDPGDIPLCGDWDGDGKASPGLYRPSTWTFYLKNSRSGGVADTTVRFGNVGDRPVVGDWDGDGRTSIGVWRPGDVTFYLSNSVTQPRADGALPLGNRTDVPVTGSWTGSRFTTIGVYRQGVYYLKHTNFPGPVDSTVGFGDTSDVPVVGDWNGDWSTTVGVVRGTGR